MNNATLPAFSPRSDAGMLVVQAQSAALITKSEKLEATIKACFARLGQGDSTAETEADAAFEALEAVRAELEALETSLRAVVARPPSGKVGSRAGR